MTELQVLLVAGTHGNEINSSWIVDQWLTNTDLIKTFGLKVSTIIGNPKARKHCSRYLDRDLNRCFHPNLLESAFHQEYEVKRAREIISNFGINSTNPCQIAIDLHSTTSAMGSSLVVYGRRPLDLALASLMQDRLGLPIYLHESDNTQQGFLVESWPCGFVVEIGPAPQGVLNPIIISQTILCIQTCFEELYKIINGLANFPDQLIIHRHIKSIDYPRNNSNKIEGFIHPLRNGQDWVPIRKGEPLFLKSNGEEIRYDEDQELTPVFINEAAYLEKNIAMSLTKREVWKFNDSWGLSLSKFLQQPLVK